MATKRDGRVGVKATIGCAANGGNGVAYARLGVSGRHLLRVPFRADGAAPERAASYAGLTAVARALRGRGVARVLFVLDDPGLLADLAANAVVPDALVLPYVRLRCALNQFDEVRLELGAAGDLAQRARAEVALHVAA